MTTMLDRLRETAAPLVRELTAALAADRVRTADDDALVELVTLGGEVLRMVEGVTIEATGEIAERSEPRLGEARLSARRGCHDANELVRRCTRASASTVRQWTVAARAVRGATDPLSGAVLPPALPALRQAMVDGHVGLDGVLAAARPLAAAAPRAAHDALLAADAAVAGEARGRLVLGRDGERQDGACTAPDGTACDADLLRVHALAWEAVLDPDGAEPAEEEAIRRRGLTLGRTERGLVTITGRLLPEVAAVLRSIHSSLNAPGAGDGTGDDGAGVRFRPAAVPDAFGDHPLDDRLASQSWHDTLATALGVAAESGRLPSLGGAAPTLVVQVREDDLVADTGRAHVEGQNDPVSIGAARHVACVGAVDRVTMRENGRIVRIGTQDRVFNRRQRRAIALRDGGCVIPGCGAPAAWCELHHVREWSRGGPTHTDNGVMLCWYHHRFLDRSGWGVRVRHGTPELRAPHWFDPSGAWRPATRSHVRLVETAVRRQ